MKTKMLALLLLAVVTTACAHSPMSPTRQSRLTVEVVTGPETQFVPVPDIAVILVRPDGTSETKRTDAHGRITWVVETSGEHTVHVYWSDGYYQMRGEVPDDARWRAIAF